MRALVTAFHVILLRTGADFLGVAHRSLERVLEGFGLRCGLVDEGLQLPQLAGLAFHFVDAHCVTS